MSLKALPVIALAACACASSSADAASKQFRDWFAVCDNVRTCSAYGLDADIFGGAYLRLERGGAADATPRVVIGVNVNEGSTFKLGFDDPSLPGLPGEVVTEAKHEDDDLRRAEISDPAVVETLLANLRKASKLIVTRIDPPDATQKSDPAETVISLSGAAAALLWIDDQQKRVGTTTALVGRGDKPATEVPAAPATPIVAAPKRPTADAPKKAPADAIAKGRAICEEKVEMEDATRLGGDDVMYWFPCKQMSGAYNDYYALVLASPGKPARAVAFLPPAGTPVPVESNINPGFDEESGVLSFFNKGRGMGDCGQASDWAWDGHAFRLISYKTMDSCKGVPQTDWPVLYRAERK